VGRRWNKLIAVGVVGNCVIWRGAYKLNSADQNTQLVSYNKVTEFMNDYMLWNFILKDA
jgi:hypothetical protein